MALKKLKTITQPNLSELSGEYWRIYKMLFFVSSDGNESTSIGLELWANESARESDEGSPITQISIDASVLLESRSSAYEWIKNNVPAFNGAEDV